MSLYSGLSAVNSQYIQSNYCINPIIATAPFDNATVLDRSIVNPNIRRAYNDINRSMLFYGNAFAVQTALVHAGIEKPTVGMTKANSSASGVGVAIGSNGNFPMMTYTNTNFDPTLPHGMTVTNAKTTGTPIDGQVLATFPNNQYLVQRSSVVPTYPDNNGFPTITRSGEPLIPHTHAPVVNNVAFPPGFSSFTSTAGLV